ncbi:transposase [Variovorax boronicumulans]|uniref:IS110 family transposase n=1 Tax=Variovorax boronicumulans TaxID=436515 RepID=UPI002781230B|nr:IS110 family transposase [Variovorax boronicumulans]MDQ0086522.1 transposase [Variovorax boronicumulans]
MNRTTYGLDIAKRVFQMYWVDADTGEIVNRRFSRTELIEFLSKSSPGRVALEACGSGHWWARKIRAFGHEAVLLHAKLIRPFVQTNKTDAADARAIWTAVQQPGMRTVAVKSEERQAVLGLHRVRTQLTKFRTMRIYQLRSLLYAVWRDVENWQAGLAELQDRMADIEGRVPGLLMDVLREQLARVRSLDEQISVLEKRIAAWPKQEASCRSLLAIPGIGPLTASALVATVGDIRTFKSGRELASFIGLVPQQRGTGGKIQLGTISKRGDPYLRTLLIHGARSVLLRSNKPNPWAEELSKRRHANIAVVALVNKMARTAWAILAHGQSYQPGYVSTRPQSQMN